MVSQGKPSQEPSKLRLNRAVAATGLCSRRHADELIEAGRVSVNGKVVTDFNRLIDPAKDQLKVDGKPLTFHEHTYVAFYKPKGVVTTRQDERGRQTIMELLPRDLQHVNPVGRLDRDSEGLLLLTNDGALAAKLTHPKGEVFKNYVVTVTGKITDRNLQELASGIELEDGFTLPADIRLISRDAMSSKFEMAIREGRNRQIRRMCAALGLRVTRLVRVSIGALQLRQMQPGQWRILSAKELKSLGIQKNEPGTNRSKT